MCRDADKKDYGLEEVHVHPNTMWIGGHREGRGERETVEARKTRFRDKGKNWDNSWKNRERETESGAEGSEKTKINSEWYSYFSE